MAAATKDDRAAALTSLLKSGPAAIEAVVKRKADADGETKQRLGTLYNAVCRGLVLEAFRKTRAKAPKESALTFAGQFNFLKPLGKHGAKGALAILKDPDLDRQFRNWAGDAIADIGDKSIMAELKAIADDFLYEDADRESAAFALAALGDSSEVKRRIRELADEYTRTKQTGIVVQIAHIHYRARQYDVAIRTYTSLIETFRRELEQRKDEMSAKQREPYEDWMGSWYYSLACNQSLSGKPQDAMKSIEQSVKLSQSARQVTMLVRDGDLTALRKLPTFATWYADLKKRAAPKLEAAKARDAKAKAKTNAEQKAKTTKPAEGEAKAGDTKQSTSGGLQPNNPKRDRDAA